MLMLNFLFSEVNTICGSDLKYSLIRVPFLYVLDRFIWSFQASVSANFIEKLNKVNESVKISACAFY